MGVRINDGGLVFTSTMDDKPFQEKMNAMEKRVNSFSSNAAKQGSLLASLPDKATKGYEAQIGLLERLKLKLKELKVEALAAPNVFSLQKINAEIQLFEKEIRRVTTAGRVGFDDMGNRIKESVEKPIGVTISRLENLASGIRSGIGKVSNPEALANLNRKLELTENRIKQMSSVGKTGFNELGNAANKSSQSIGGKLFSGLKTVANILPGIGIAGLIGFAAEPILKYVSTLGIFGDKVKQLSENLKNYNDINREAFKDAGKQTTDLRILYTAATDVNNSIENRTKAARQLQKQFPDAFAASKISAILAGKESDKIRQLTKDIYANAQARAAVTKIEELAAQKLDAQFQKRKIQAANFNEKRKITGDVFVNTGGDSKDLRSNKVITVAEQRSDSDKRAKAAAALQDKIISDKDNQIKFLTSVAGGNNKLAKTLGDGDGGKSDESAAKKTANALKVQQRADDSALKAKQALQQRITDIDNEYARKSKTKDEEEIQAIRDKFVKIAEEVKIFNADPKHKYKVDGSGLDKTRDAAIADLTYQQDTAKLSLKLENDKKLYEEYEDFKLQFGEKKANERFGKEVNYQKVLNEELAKFSFRLPGTLDANEQARYDEIKKRSEDYVKEEQKKNQALLLEFQIYSEERKRIEEKYASAAAGLRKVGEEEAAQNAIKQGQAEITELDEQNVHKWKSYKNLFDNLESMSRQQTLQAIDEYENELRSFTGTNEAKEALLKELAKLKKSIQKGGGLKDVIDGFDRVATDFAKINGSISGITTVLISAARSFVDIKEGISDFKTAKNTTGKITAGLGIAGAAINIASSVVGYFKGLKAAKQEAKKAIDEFNATALSGELAYQATLRDRERQQTKLNDLTVKGLKDTAKLLGQQSGSIQSEYQRVLAQLQGQQFVASETYNHGTWLKKASTTQNMGGLSGKSYDQIEQLYVQGKLTEGAKKLFEELQKLKKEGADVNDMMAQLGEQAKQVFTGTTADNLTNSLLEMFKDGKTGAKDFADFFQDTMKTAALSIFKNNVLAASMAKFFDEFSSAAQSDDTLTDTEVTDLQGKFKVVTDNISKKFEELKKVTGLNFDLPKGTDTLSLTGSLNYEIIEIKNYFYN